MKKINSKNKKTLTQQSIMTIDLAVMHSFQWNKYPAEDLYKNLVKSGLLDSRSFAFTTDNKSFHPYSKSDTLTGQSGEYGNSLGFRSGGFFFITEGNTSSFKFDLEKVNLNRSEIYLDNIFNELNRCAWTVVCSEKPYYFSNYWSLPTDDTFPKSYIQNISEKNLPIKIIDKTNCSNFHSN